MIVKIAIGVATAGAAVCSFYAAKNVGINDLNFGLAAIGAVISVIAVIVLSRSLKDTGQ